MVDEKEYITPSLKIALFVNEDVICTSFTVNGAGAGGSIYHEYETETATEDY